MRHFVAYHKVDEWGEYGVGGTRFDHYSAHPRSRLEKTLGQAVWVVSGQRMGRRMVYKLCSAYEPTAIEDDGDGFRVAGGGRGFDPHLDVNGCPWLSKLLQEQNNFRYGLNEIKSRAVIEGLIRIRDTIGTSTDRYYPDEIRDPQTFPEGARRRVVINAYERNSRARTRSHPGPLENKGYFNHRRL
jgi:hypothetical protein